MRVYLAGGFHFSNTFDTEMELAKELLKRYGKYNRLCTFYYKKDANNILKVKEKLDENSRVDSDS